MKGSQKFSVTLKYLKDAEVMISLTFPFTWPAWPIQDRAGLPKWPWIITNIIKRRFCYNHSF